MTARLSAGANILDRPPDCLQAPLMTSRPRRWPHVQAYALAARGLVLVVLSLTAACANEAPDPTPSETAFTKGAIPETAWRANGSIDMTQVPDFIPATDGDSTAGWIASRDALGPAEDRPEIITVFADDLVTVVGHMYPEIGFVPLGAEDELVPPADQDRDLSILVRNESDQPAVLEIIEAADEVDHRPLLIAPTITLEAGEEREVRLRAPRDRWSLRLRGDLGFFFSDDLGEWARDPAAFALVITPAGVLEIERGRQP
jgi:hypothetical protein